MPPDAEKICTDNEIFQDNSLQISQQSQTFQRHVLAEEKWEASIAEGVCCCGACVAAV